MNRYLTIVLTTAAACTVHAQTANPLSTEAKQAYTGVKNNVTKLADKVPEADYGFKATPEMRSMGQLIGHVADSQMRTCSAVNGAAKQPTASSKTAKADLVAALKESFAECDKAFESLTDATAAKMVKTARGERTSLGALMGTTSHSNEEYGYLAVYLRLKGIVPPSSEPR